MGPESSAVAFEGILRTNIGTQKKVSDNMHEHSDATACFILRKKANVDVTQSSSLRTCNLGNRQAQRTNGRCFGIEQMGIILGNRQAQRTNGRCFGIGIATRQLAHTHMDPSRPNPEGIPVGLHHHTHGSTTTKTGG